MESNTEQEQSSNKDSEVSSTFAGDSCSEAINQVNNTEVNITEIDNNIVLSPDTSGSVLTFHSERDENHEVEPAVVDDNASNHTSEFEGDTTYVDEDGETISLDRNILKKTRMEAGNYTVWNEHEDNDESNSVTETEGNQSNVDSKPQLENTINNHDEQSIDVTSATNVIAGDVNQLDGTDVSSGTTELPPLQNLKGSLSSENNVADEQSIDVSSATSECLQENLTNIPNNADVGVSQETEFSSLIYDNMEGENVNDNTNPLRDVANTVEQVVDVSSATNEYVNNIQNIAETNSELIESRLDFSNQSVDVSSATSDPLEEHVNTSPVLAESVSDAIEEVAFVSSATTEQAQVVEQANENLLTLDYFTDTSEQSVDVSSATTENFQQLENDDSILLEGSQNITDTQSVNISSATIELYSSMSALGNNAVNNDNPDSTTRELSETNNNIVSEVGEDVVSTTSEENVTTSCSSSTYSDSIVVSASSERRIQGTNVLNSSTENIVPDVEEHVSIENSGISSSNQSANVLEDEAKLIEGGELDETESYHFEKEVSMVLKESVSSSKDISDFPKSVSSENKSSKTPLGVANTSASSAMCVSTSEGLDSKTVKAEALRQNVVDVEVPSVSFAQDDMSISETNVSSVLIPRTYEIATNRHEDNSSLDVEADRCNVLSNKSLEYTVHVSSSRDDAKDMNVTADSDAEKLSSTDYYKRNNNSDLATTATEETLVKSLEESDSCIDEKVVYTSKSDISHYSNLKCGNSHSPSASNSFSEKVIFSSNMSKIDAKVSNETVETSECVSLDEEVKSPEAESACDTVKCSKSVSLLTSNADEPQSYIDSIRINEVPPPVLNRNFTDDKLETNSNVVTGMSINEKSNDFVQRKISFYSDNMEKLESKNSTNKSDMQCEENIVAESREVTSNISDCHPNPQVEIVHPPDDDQEGDSTCISKKLLSVDTCADSPIEDTFPLQEVEKPDDNVCAIAENKSIFTSNSNVKSSVVSSDTLVHDESSSLSDNKLIATIEEYTLATSSSSEEFRVGDTTNLENQLEKTLSSSVADDPDTEESFQFNSAIIPANASNLENNGTKSVEVTSGLSLESNTSSMEKNVQQNNLSFKDSSESLSFLEDHSGEDVLTTFPINVSEEDESTYQQDRFTSTDKNKVTTIDKMLSISEENNAVSQEEMSDGNVHDNITPESNVYQPVSLKSQSGDEVQAEEFSCNTVNVENKNTNNYIPITISPTEEVLCDNVSKDIDQLNNVDLSEVTGSENPNNNISVPTYDFEQGKRSPFAIVSKCKDSQTVGVEQKLSESCDLDSLEENVSKALESSLIEDNACTKNVCSTSQLPGQDEKLFPSLISNSGQDMSKESYIDIIQSDSNLDSKTAEDIVEQRDDSVLSDNLLPFSTDISMSSSCFDESLLFTETSNTANREDQVLSESQAEEALNQLGTGELKIDSTETDVEITDNSISVASHNKLTECSNSDSQPVTVNMFMNEVRKAEDEAKANFERSTENLQVERKSETIPGSQLASLNDDQNEPIEGENCHYKRTTPNSSVSASSDSIDSEVSEMKQEFLMSESDVNISAEEAPSCNLVKPNGNTPLEKSATDDSNESMTHEMPNLLEKDVKDESSFLVRSQEESSRTSEQSDAVLSENNDTGSIKVTVSAVDSFQQTPKVEKMTLKVRKEAAMKESFSGDVKKVELSSQDFSKDEDKVEKITLKLPKASESTSFQSTDILIRKSDSQDKLPLKILKFGDKRGLDEKDSQSGKEEKVEKLKLKLSKPTEERMAELIQPMSSRDSSKVEKLKLKFTRPLELNIPELDLATPRYHSNIEKLKLSPDVSHLVSPREIAKIEKLRLTRAKSTNISDSVFQEKSTWMLKSSDKSTCFSEESSSKDSHSSFEKITLKIKKDIIKLDSPKKDSCLSEKVHLSASDISERKVEKITLKLKADDGSGSNTNKISNLSASKESDETEILCFPSQSVGTATKQDNVDVELSKENHSDQNKSKAVNSTNVLDNIAVVSELKGSISTLKRKLSVPENDKSLHLEEGNKHDKIMLTLKKENAWSVKKDDSEQRDVSAVNFEIQKKRHKLQEIDSSFKDTIIETIDITSGAISSPSNEDKDLCEVKFLSKDSHESGSNISPKRLYSDYSASSEKYFTDPSANKKLKLNESSSLTHLDVHKKDICKTKSAISKDDTTETVMSKLKEILAEVEARSSAAQPCPPLQVLDEGDFSSSSVDSEDVQIIDIVRKDAHIPEPVLPDESSSQDIVILKEVTEIEKLEDSAINATGLEGCSQFDIESKTPLKKPRGRPRKVVSDGDTGVLKQPSSSDPARPKRMCRGRERTESSGGEKKPRGRGKKRKSEEQLTPGAVSSFSSITEMKDISSGSALPIITTSSGLEIIPIVADKSELLCSPTFSNLPQPPASQNTVLPMKKKSFLSKIKSKSISGVHQKAVKQGKKSPLTKNKTSWSNIDKKGASPHPLVTTETCKQPSEESDRGTNVPSFPGIPAPIVTSNNGASLISSLPSPTIFSTPTDVDASCTGTNVSSVQVFEEETRMSGESGSRSQTPARTLPPTGGSEAVGEESLSSLSTATTESVKKKNRMEVCDAEVKEFTVDQIAEYQWPPEKGGDHLMIQEQISEYLGVKSFKRKYPDLRRRPIEAEEKTYLQEKGLVAEKMCDMGLTAVVSSEVLDVMFADFQEKYEEYRKYLRDKQAKELSSKQKANAMNSEKGKVDTKEIAVNSAAEWNTALNKAREDSRRACFDLQSFTIHYPHGRRVRMAPRDLQRIGHYPVAVIPGQYTDYYKSYTPAELRYFPVNTVLYGPMKPNERERERERENSGGSDGSQSDSDSSSSSDDSSTSSSDDSDDSASEPGDGGVIIKEECNQEIVLQPESNKERENARCKVCNGDKTTNKAGRPEVLIDCAQCTSSGHPSCLGLTLDMVPHIRRYDWQCTDCKTCIQCKDPADEDKMLFCDMCDRGYHIYCVGLRRVPSGRWHCKECAVCGSCGTTDPDPGNVNAQWQHEYKKGERNTRIYAQTLCYPCSKLWKKGWFCQLCYHCFTVKPEEDTSLIACSVCEKWMHSDCCSALNGTDFDRNNYLCELCQEKGTLRSSLKLTMRPMLKV